MRFLFPFDETVCFVFAGGGPVKPLEELVGDTDFGMLAEDGVEIPLDRQCFDVAGALIVEQLGGHLPDDGMFAFGVGLVLPDVFQMEPDKGFPIVG